MIESAQQKMERNLNILEIDSTYNWKDIEKQYRQLIHRWHPDRNLGANSDAAQTRFIEINSAYKAIREQYRKSGAIPRHVPTEQSGPLLGTRKEVIARSVFYKNKFVIAALLALTLLATVGAVLWSLESKLAENNRDRASVQKSIEAEAAAVESKLKEQVTKTSHSVKQANNELE